jgi:peroxiredoxin Q/BCP
MAAKKSPGKTTATKSAAGATKSAAGRKSGQASGQESDQGSNHNKAPPARDPLAPGAKAPAFTLPRDGGGSISLAEFAGHKLVLYFYPRADTSGCTKEAIDFSRLEPAFRKADTRIVGVSADPIPAQDKFKSKYKLTIALASDEGHRMLEAYGVWREKSLYGRKFLGVVRATFLIGPDLRIARVWPKVAVEGHAEEVLGAAKAL